LGWEEGNLTDLDAAGLTAEVAAGAAQASAEDARPTAAAKMRAKEALVTAQVLLKT